MNSAPNTTRETIPAKSVSQLHGNNQKGGLPMQKRYEYKHPSRLEYLTLKYGECCSRVKAGEILDRSAASISQMVRDGRLQEVCGGKKICMQSIAEYMENADMEDRKVRLTKKNGKPPRFFV